MKTGAMRRPGCPLAHHALQHILAQHLLLAHAQHQVFVAREQQRA